MRSSVRRAVNMLWLLLLYLVISSRLVAQTVVVRTDRLHWTQTASTLVQAQGFQYRVYLDVTALAVLQGVICTGAVSPFDCTAAMPLMAVGIHTIELTAVDLAESPRSAPFIVQVTAAPTAPTNVGIVMMTAPINYTHWVTPTGTDTGTTCTQIAPCSLRLALAGLAGTSDMPCGSVVSVAAGMYSQAAITYPSSRGCPLGNFVKFIGQPGVFVTGLRTKLDPTTCTPVVGRTYTRQCVWNEADSGKFEARVLAQLAPVTWTPIVVNDRFAPFTSPSAREITLDVPIGYTRYTSLNDVEAHKCSFWDDTTTNLVYLDMCHGGAPTANDDVWVGDYNWGGIQLAGDDLWLDNIGFKYSVGTGVLSVGLSVAPTGDGNVLTHVTLRSAQLYLRGTNTLAEDLDLGYLITQGPPASGCWDEDTHTAGVAARACFNSGGDGMALGIGDATNPLTSYGQIVRRAFIHQGWNCCAIAGANTFEDSIVWGFPNHGMTAETTGMVIRNNVFMNSQDSLYVTPAFDDITVEHNLFGGGSLFWMSPFHDGTTPTTSWIYRNNITTSQLIEEASLPGMVSDCNLWIPTWDNSSGFSFQNANNVNYAGTAAYNYTSLAAVQANTPFEDNGAELAYTKWTDGTQFVRFTTQKSPSFDFHPVLGARALTMSGCGRVGPYDALP